MRQLYEFDRQEVALFQFLDCDAPFYTVQPTVHFVATTWAANATATLQSTAF